MIEPAFDAGGDPKPTRPSKERKEPWLTRRFGVAPLAATVVEWVVLVGTTLIVSLLIKTFLVTAFYIPSESMVPTLLVNDRILVNKLATSPDRAEIVVFNTPPLLRGSGPSDLVKRVIGLPGETIEGREGAVWINGRRLAEPYLPKGVTTPDFAPRALGPHEYFMMGDNRNNSEDSRVFGPINQSEFVGEAFFRFWPLSRLGTP